MTVGLGEERPPFRLKCAYSRWLSRRVVGETWKSVRGFPAYAVSDQGRVMRILPVDNNNTYLGKILKGVPNTAGYLQLNLFYESKKRVARVHRLVLEAFVGPCPEGKEANHIDGNPLNNRPENLEWVTHAGNMSHAYSLGLIPVPQGSKNGSAKLTETDIPIIRQRLADGEFQRVIARDYGVRKQTIGYIARGETWSHV